MFGDILPKTAITQAAMKRYVTIAEVLPAVAPELCSCSYCGKVKRVAYHIISANGREAVTCYPCADQGMNWLERNFPTVTDFDVLE